MLTVSQMMAAVAPVRSASRGSHFRSDDPEGDNDDWRQIIFQHWEDGILQLRCESFHG